MCLLYTYSQHVALDVHVDESTQQPQQQQQHRYSTEYSAALAYDKMAIVLLGDRARTNYDRAAVAQLLQEPLQEEGSGDGANGWEASSEDAQQQVGVSHVVGPQGDADATGAREPSTHTEGAPSLVDATTTHYERHEQLGGLMHNMLAAAEQPPPLDSLMQRLGQHLGPIGSVRGD